MGRWSHETLSTTQACQELALLQEEVGAGCSKRNTSVVENLLQFAPPPTAAGVAVFGLGVAALPLLAHCLPDNASTRAETGGALEELADKQAHPVFSYARYAEKRGLGESAKLFTIEELSARLGPMDPARVCAEMQLEVLDVVFQASRASQEDLKAEVQMLQSWSDSTQAALSSLERRAALAYLGLAMDAEPEAIHRSYKQRALAVHPDKGGSDEDFLNLQEMVGRLRDADVEDEQSNLRGRGGNLYQNLKEMMRKAKENKEKNEGGQEPMQGPSDEIKMQQRRAALHDTTLKFWGRAQAAQQQLGEAATCKDRRAHLLEPMHRLVDDLAGNIEDLPRGSSSAVAGERLLCRMLRRGIDALASASLVDATATVAHVAVNFTGPLLKVVKDSGPCPELELRCRLLLSSLGDVPRAFGEFMQHVQDSLDNKFASEWRGCNQAQAPAEQRPQTDGNGQAPPDSAPSAEGGQHATVEGEGSASGLRGGEAAEPAAEPVKESLEVCSSESQVMDLQKRYTETQEWRAIRVACVRKRLCVDFNRNAADERCQISDCGFKHACAVCGAMQKGSRRFQHKHHGAWDCPMLTCWLASDS